jgi:hypothetical protein
LVVALPLLIILGCTGLKQQATEIPPEVIQGLDMTDAEAKALMDQLAAASYEDRIVIWQNELTQDQRDLLEQRYSGDVTALLIPPAGMGKEPNYERLSEDHSKPTEVEPGEEIPLNEEQARVRDIIEQDVRNVLSEAGMKIDDKQETIIKLDAEVINKLAADEAKMQELTDMIRLEEAEKLLIEIYENSGTITAEDLAEMVEAMGGKYQRLNIQDFKVKPDDIKDESD